MPLQPGETITPGGQPPVPEPTKQVDASVEQPVVDATTPTAQPNIAQESDTSWQFAQDDTMGTDATAAGPNSPATVKWTASEYIAHNKGSAWFALLGVGLFVLVGVVYLLTKDVVASVMVGVAGATFGVFAARPPRVLNYQVDRTGITIGQRHYPFAEFKSFAIVEEGPLPSVLLLPLKRFLPPITVFYDPKEEDAIINTLGSYLPHENKEPDLVDRLMSRIRF
jgi:hypothetical protein